MNKRETKMKTRYFLAFALVLSALFSGCATNDVQTTAATVPSETTDNAPPPASAKPVEVPDPASLVFLPKPRSLNFTGGNLVAAAEPTVKVDPSAMPHAQGYLLDVSSVGVAITGHDEAGVFYARQTLKQLQRQYEGVEGFPALHIEDWPDFPNRGVMLDVSRDKVPTMETLHMLADMFAELKYNQIQLYTEHTFAYKGHETVWKDASPLTGEEIREYDAYCRERFIELVPNQNSFGHMERWLKHPEYTPLAEKPGAGDLCPVNPACVDFLAGLYADMLPNFSSGQFNVGCDETWSLGKGCSKEAAATMGMGPLYLGFLLKIHDLVKANGKKMQFWGDIIMQYPELIPQIPPDVIAMEWGYEAAHPFAEHGRKFAASGIPFYVVPGTSSWNSLLGRTNNSLENLRNAAVNGMTNGSIGYLVTDWGDNGHWQFLPVSFAPFAYGAALSWCAQENTSLPLAKALDVHVFMDAAGKMGQAVLDLGNAHTITGVSIGNSSVYYGLLLSAVQGSPVKGPLKGMTIAGNDAAITAISDAVSRIGESDMRRPDAGLIKSELETNAALAALSLKIGSERLKNGNVSTSQLPKETGKTLAAELDTLISRQKSVWLSRNREGGLADSAGRLENFSKILKKDLTK